MGRSEGSDICSASPEAIEEEARLSLSTNRLLEALDHVIAVGSVYLGLRRLQPANIWIIIGDYVFYKPCDMMTP